MEKVKIIAHQDGFLPEGSIPEVQDRYEIPENTLEAFERAFENGWGTASGICTDHPTKTASATLK